MYYPRLYILVSFFSFQFLFTGDTNASPVEIKDNLLTLSGNLEQVNGKYDRVYLLVHGTWAHGKMEIMSSLQNLLSESEEDSLAITLSLGVDRRKGFMNCESPVTARHDAAVNEIRLWVNYLSKRWSEVIIIGHSRGGNQVALYSQSVDSNKVKKVVLIAPMSWNKTLSETAYKKRFGVELSPLIAYAKSHRDGRMKGGLINCDDAEFNADSFLSYYSSHPNRNTPELLGSVLRPTLVVLGSNDDLSKQYQVASKMVKMDTAVTEVWIDGAGHFFRDFYADELVELMLQWVSE